MAPIVIVQSAGTAALAPSLWFVLMLGVIFFTLSSSRFGKDIGLVASVAGLILIPVCVAIEKFIDSKAQIVQSTEQTVSAVRQEDKTFIGKMDEQTVQNRTIGVKILKGN